MFSIVCKYLSLFAFFMFLWECHFNHYPLIYDLLYIPTINTEFVKIKITVYTYILLALKLKIYAESLFFKFVFEVSSIYLMFKNVTFKLSAIH